MGRLEIREPRIVLENSSLCVKPGKSIVGHHSMIGLKSVKSGHRRSVSSWTSLVPSMGWLEEAAAMRVLSSPSIVLETLQWPLG